MLSTLIVMCSQASAASGDLDATFDGDGRVIFDLGDTSFSPSDMLVQPDVKIVVQARRSSPFA